MLSIGLLLGIAQIDYCSLLPSAVVVWAPCRINSPRVDGRVL